MTNRSGEDDEEQRRTTVLRRPFLRSVGIVGGIAASIPGLASATTADTSEQSDAAAFDAAEEWEAQADARIQDHRTATLDVHVVDADGVSLEGASVDVEMQEHAFTFGTALDANRLQEDSDDAEQYREYVPELFNAAVLENHHKWRFWEENQELADEATDWILEQGLDLRGHACLWADRDSYAVPADVEDAIDDGDAETVEERTQEHIETIIDHYGDDMRHWDVVNEVIHEPEIIELIEGDDVDPVEAPILAEWYRTATAVAPDDVALDVNDYNVLVGPYEGTRDDYERQIEFLAGDDEVDLDGIGMQGHFAENEQLAPDEIMDALDRYAEAGDGAELRITEFDMADSDWPEEEKAEFFHWFLKTAYSHPDVSDFLMWGFWDDEHWLDDAPLFDENWEEKPAYDTYTDLVFDEWWTAVSDTTDEDGSISTTAFHGTHTVTVEYDGVTVTETVSVNEDDTIEIELDDVGSGETLTHHDPDDLDDVDDDVDHVIQWTGSSGDTE
ncbi:endo-1,4-beta-xylanase [Natrialbaceae archaeon A-arb3/5]